MITKVISEMDPEIFVIDIKLHRSKMSTLDVQVDTDEGITLDQVTRISRRIGRFLDEELELEFAYKLDVGSPGVGKPLKVLRQYNKNVGRELKVRMNTGEEFKGKLISVDDKGILLEIKRKIKGKGKKVEVVEKSVDFEQIKEAKIQVSFK